MGGAGCFFDMRGLVKDAYRRGKIDGVAEYKMRGHWRYWT